MGNAAIGFGVVIFIIGFIILLHAFIVEWTTPFTELDISGNITQKFIGGMIMLAPIALALGLSSGTGRRGGGRRGKGTPNF
jgi:uncharacterized membrane protein